MPSFVDFFATIGNYLPGVAKPLRKLTLGEKLIWTAVAALIFLIMTSTPLYGVIATSTQNLLLQQIIFASTNGTLAQLGVGPIITSGLIMQILVGSKIIELDLTSPEDKKKFTTAQKGLTLIFIVVESSLYGYSLAINSANVLIYTIIIASQLIVSTYIILLLDELIQKGWGLGSGVSLFILAGVAKIMFWDMFGIASVSSQSLPVGFIPSIIGAILSNNQTIISHIIINSNPGYRPDLIGFISTIVLIFLLIYLLTIKIEIPITSQQLRGIRRTIPLNFLYVSSIPVIFVSIVVADISLFTNLIGRISSGAQEILSSILNYLVFPPPGYSSSSPYGVMSVYLYPVQATVFTLVFILLSVLFGLLWIQVSGLDPATQAENLVRSGIEVPGMRKSPRVLEAILAKYIHPLTVLSSLIVGILAAVATLLGSYGTGTGILLAITIAQQYYSLIAYERTLEMYPLLKRVLGEE